MNARKLAIEHHDFIGGRFGFFERFLPIIGKIDGEASLAQSAPDHIRQRHFIFRHQHAHYLNISRSPRHPAFS